MPWVSAASFTTGLLGARTTSGYTMHLGREMEPQHGTMRVVVFEPNADNREGLLRGVDEVTGFHVVGESGSWDDCRWLVDAYFPELLIARTHIGQSGPKNSAGNITFPVVLGLRTKDDENLDCGFEVIDLPLNPKLLRAAMERVRTEIYRRKLDEISDLLRSYVNFSRGFHRYLTAIRVEDGESTEMRAENVMFMAADGNHVRLHTGTAVHEIRETMSGMTSKLDPEQFARVHRSFIVNRAYVTGVLHKEGAAMAVLLSNGIEIPVGPNYRAEVDSYGSYNLLSA